MNQSQFNPENNNKNKYIININNKRNTSRKYVKMKNCLRIHLNY